MRLPFPFALRGLHIALDTAGPMKLFFLKYTPLLEKLIPASCSHFRVHLKREILKLLYNSDIIFSLV